MKMTFNGSAPLRVRTAAVLLGLAFLAAGCDLELGDLHAQSVEGTFERTLTVNGPVELDVHTGSGDIQIRAGSDNSVHVTGHVKARGARALATGPQQQVDQIRANPPVTQSGNTVHIGVTGNDAIFQNVSITYEVTVPANAKIQARTGSGDIGIAMKAASVDAKTGSGDINVLGASEGLMAQTGSGDVRAGRIAGAMNAETGSGDIQAEQTAAGPVEMRTGSGDVTLKLANEAAFNLSVRTGSGSITTTHPVTSSSSRNRNRLDGTVRGGGPLVDIRTGSGDVTIN
jgi:DUF4097 and DUF4098 domain-containing protein YvlB